MPTLVIGDIHGNPGALRDILRRSGALAVNGRRAKGWRIISVGDLVNLAPPGSMYRGFVAEDAEVLRMMVDRNLIDTVTVGNHEAAISHDIHASGWYGMASKRQLAPYVTETLAALRSQGRYCAAAEAHGWLVTHAGVDPRFQDDLPDAPEDAAGALNVWIERDPNQPVISDCGPAVGGWNTTGGILWLRPAEQTGQPAAKWPQIVGHTPHPKNPWYDAARGTWYVDSGGYLERPGKGAGIAWNESLKTWEVVD